MASTDEIIADPVGALDIPEAAIVTRVVMVVEYFEPASDDEPGRPRLAFTSSDDCAPWSVMAMIRFAEQIEFRAVKNAVEDDD
jgi:hypothetical protein